MLDKDRIRMIDQKRIAFFLVFVFMFVITEIGRNVYRPYIYSNQLFDFWIADTIGNFTGTIAIVFFDIAIVNPRYKQGRIFLMIITLGLIISTILSRYLPYARISSGRGSRLLGGLW